MNFEVQAYIWGSIIFTRNVNSLIVLKFWRFGNLSRIFVKKTWISSQNTLRATRRWISSSNPLHDPHICFSSVIMGFVCPLSIHVASVWKLFLKFKRVIQCFKFLKIFFEFVFAQRVVGKGRIVSWIISYRHPVCDILVFITYSTSRLDFLQFVIRWYLNCWIFSQFPYPCTSALKTQVT